MKIEANCSGTLSIILEKLKDAFPQLETKNYEILRV